jgi:hypothetical protein
VSQTQRARRLLRRATNACACHPSSLIRYDELLGADGLREFNRLFVLGFLALQANHTSLTSLVAIMIQRPYFECFAVCHSGSATEQKHTRARILQRLKDRLMVGAGPKVQSALRHFDRFRWIQMTHGCCCVCLNFVGICRVRDGFSRAKQECLHHPAV